MGTKGDIVCAIDNAVFILDVIMSNRSSMALKEIVEITHFPKSTVHRYLNSLRQRGLVCQDEDGKYLLGNHLFEYGMSVFNSWDFVQLTNPLLAKMTSQTGKSSILSAINNDFPMNVNYHPSSKSRLQVAPCIGTRIPFHATAQGKVFLAGMEDKKIKKIILENKMQRYTENTITDENRLLAEINQIRKTGVAFANSEYRMGNRVISVPVKNKDGNTIFALALIERSDEQISGVEESINTLKDCAEQIAALKNVEFQYRY